MSSVLLVAVVCAGVAVVSHLLIRRFLVATLVSAIGSTALLQLIVRIQVGHGDPFALITVPLSMLIAGAFAVPVGLVIAARRRSREPRRE